MTKEEILCALEKAIVEGEIDKAGEITQEAVHAEIPAPEAIRVAAEAMKESGRLFEEKEYYVADLIASAEAMKSALAVLQPLITASKAEATGRVILGTVQGDVHDIGKNLVATVMQAAGFEVFDLGINVRAETFAEKAKELQADIVGTSAYTSTAMAYQRDVLTELEKCGLRDQVFYMVGGAPTNAEWAKSIGADGWAEDAWQAAKVAADLIAHRPR